MVNEEEKGPSPWPGKVWITLFGLAFCFSFPGVYAQSLGSPRFLHDRSTATSSCTPPITLPVPTKLQHNWGPYTPWYAVGPYKPLPKGCTITQVNILQRHGARYPTKDSNKKIQASLEKILSANHTHPSLAFLKGYKYDLGSDQLVRFGAEQSKYTGSEAFVRYRHLVSEDNIPFVRASGKQRVVDSATNWTLGFAEASRNQYIPKLNVILDEKLNDTLDNSQCPLAGDSSAQVDLWTSHFAFPIASRLNAYAPGALNLSASDVYNLMLICPFETTAHISASPFCSPSLFSLAEFAQLAYAFDLDKFYQTGYGQPLGRVQGVGYVNELIARLTREPVRDHTQTNSTLDGNGETFPLDRNLYVDFTHDNLMIAVYGAMGLFVQKGGMLDPQRPDLKRTWRANRMVPFSSRMVTEKMVCTGRGKEGKEYVRVLVNDAVQVDFCAKEGEEKELCELKEFVKSQRYARQDGEGDWEKCHA